MGSFLYFSLLRQPEAFSHQFVIPSLLSAEGEIPEPVFLFVCLLFFGCINGKETRLDRFFYTMQTCKSLVLRMF